MADNQSQETDTSIRHYYIDEGGDGTLFSKRGKVLVGTEGCSRFFILGLLEVPNPIALQHTFDDLRAQLMSDPYFNDVPPCRPSGGKTAVAFHAKDDLPEVRREVFRLLRGAEELRFFAVVADKWRALEYVREQNESDPDYRYHPNELYDYLVRRLFKQRLHRSSKISYYFFETGKIRSYCCFA